MAGIKASGVNIGGDSGTLLANALNAYDGAVDRMSELDKRKRQAEIERLQMEQARLNHEATRANTQGVTIRNTDAQIALDIKQNNLDKVAEDYTTGLDAGIADNRFTIDTAGSRTQSTNAVNEANVVVANATRAKAVDDEAQRKRVLDIKNGTELITALEDEMTAQMGLDDKRSLFEISREYRQATDDQLELQADVKRATAAMAAIMTNNKNAPDLLGSMYDLPAGSVSAIEQRADGYYGIGADGNVLTTGVDDDNDGKPDPVMIDPEFFTDEAVANYLPNYYKGLLDRAKIGGSAKAIDYNKYSDEMQSAVYTAITGKRRPAENIAMVGEEKDRYDAALAWAGAAMQNNPDQNLNVVVNKARFAFDKQRLIGMGQKPDELEGAYQKYLAGYANAGKEPPLNSEQAFWQQAYEIAVHNMNNPDNPLVKQQ